MNKITFKDQLLSQDGYTITNCYVNGISRGSIGVSGDSYYVHVAGEIIGIAHTRQDAKAKFYMEFESKSRRNTLRKSNYMGRKAEQRRKSRRDRKEQV